MSTEAIQVWQGWVAIVGAILTAVVAIFKYFRFQSKRDIRAAVGAYFASTVEALGSDKETSRMAGAVLIRRFFDRHTEQGAAGTPYIREAIALIAGMLRDEKLQEVPRLQKVLADGLGYAIDLQNVDLQQCNLRNAYFGTKPRDVGNKPRRFVTMVRPLLRTVRYFGRKAPDTDVVVNLSHADLFESKCARASFKQIVAQNTVFYRAELQYAVLRKARCYEANFSDADCKWADFREAKLFKSNFEGAEIEGAQFAGAEGIPVEVANLLDQHMVGRQGAVVPKPAGSR